MDSKPVKRMSFSLVLIFLLLLLIAALIFIFIKVKTTTYTEDSTDISNNTTPDISMNFSTEINNITNVIENTSNFENISNEISTNEISNELLNENTNELSNNSTSKKLTLNNHTFAFDNSIHASITTDSKLQFLYPDFDYKMIIDTNTVSFDTLKSNSSLKTYLENQLNISITSDIKSGTVQNINIIACTALDNTAPVYLVITSLNDSEVLTSKIYNTKDSSKLVTDLTDPLTQISTIKSSLEN